MGAEDLQSVPSLDLMRRMQLRLRASMAAQLGEEVAIPPGDLLCLLDELQAVDTAIDACRRHGRGLRLYRDLAGPTRNLEMREWLAAYGRLTGTSEGDDGR